MINFTFRQLSLFEATARLGQLTLAADEQAISQSAASQAIKELEGALKNPLFYRTGRELRLTSYGEQLLPRVKQLLARAINLKAVEQDQISGTIHLTVCATVGSYILPRALAIFQQKFPAINLDIQIKSTHKVIQAIEKGYADIGGIEHDAETIGLDRVEISEDQLKIFCAPQHTLAQKGMITAADFANYTWILKEKEDSTRDLFDKEVYKLGAQLTKTLTFTEQDAIKEYVKVGLGLGCLSQFAIMDELKSGQLVELKAPFCIKRKLVMLRRKESYLDPATKAFTNFILANKGIGVQLLTNEHMKDQPED
jgi:DNA-binding transcriptional LysR family regulator